MKSSGLSLRRFTGKLFFFCLLTIGVLPLSVRTMQAQQSGPSQRVVQGQVVDKGDAPLRGAVVYLKDNHTLAVRSFVADDNGRYRFGQLAQNTDYELWATSNGHKSGSRSISSFDSKMEFNFILKIDTTK